MTGHAQTLCSFAVERDRRSTILGLSDLWQSASDPAADDRVPGLVGYIGQARQPLLTREAVEALAAVPIREASHWVERPDGGKALVSETAAFLRLEDRGGPEPDIVVYARLGQW